MLDNTFIFSIALTLISYLTYYIYFKIKPQLEFQKYLTNLKVYLENKKMLENEFLKKLEDQTLYNENMLTLINDLTTSTLCSLKGNVEYLQYKLASKEIVLRYTLESVAEISKHSLDEYSLLNRYKIFEKSSPTIQEWDGLFTTLQDTIKDITSLTLKLEEHVGGVDQLDLPRCGAFHFIKNESLLKEYHVSSADLALWEEKVLPIHWEKGDLIVDAIFRCKVTEHLDTQLSKLDSCLNNFAKEIENFHLEPLQIFPNQINEVEPSEDKYDFPEFM